MTIKKNYIDTIIRIPNEINRSRPEVVIVFRKNKPDEDILFIDMSADYETQRTKLNYPGLFRKNLILDDKTVDKMVGVFAKRLSLPKFSSLISIEEIEKNNFNLSVSRFVDTFEGEFISLDDHCLTHKLLSFPEHIFPSPQSLPKSDSLPSHAKRPSDKIPSWNTNCPDCRRHES